MNTQVGVSRPDNGQAAGSRPALGRGRQCLALLAGALLVLCLPGCRGASDNGAGSAGSSPSASGSTAGGSTAAGSASGGASGGSLVIGEYGSLTGGTADFGTSTDNGIQLAVEKADSAGGALGKQLEVIVKDDGSNTEQARTTVEALVNQGVTAVLGEVASSRSLQGAPVCQEHHVPMISPSSTNPRVTQVGDYIFRVCFIDSFQGKAIGEVGSDILHAKNAVILFDNGQDYSKGLADYIAQSFQQKGGKILDRFSYSSGDNDFRSQLTSIKNLNPQVIFVPGYYTEVALIARQARELGITAPLVGGDGWDSPHLTENAGDALNGCYFTDHFSADEKNPAVQSFVQSYEGKYNGQAPDAMAALGYDAAGILVDAMKRSKTTDEPALRDAIASTKNYPGVTGSITIGPDRNAIKPIVVIKIQNGKFTFNSRINP